ncbi:hypothetical protein CYMTET_26707 [Cymbomonas tetramitiformis]|uniref:Uncharacterized protein n=1 Tax=Cymbomonas tetramitiformis TaxID=36881 RepID=A0AAE0FRJ9_9CHLO|nr:hypothetical protein CYMTET_26707 [Cymbomonas tetramitiformis]
MVELNGFAFLIYVVSRRIGRWCVVGVVVVFLVVGVVVVVVVVVVEVVAVAVAVAVAVVVVVVKTFGCFGFGYIRTQPQNARCLHKRFSVLGSVPFHVSTEVPPMGCANSSAKSRLAVAATAAPITGEVFGGASVGHYATTGGCTGYCLTSAGLRWCHGTGHCLTSAGLRWPYRAWKEKYGVCDAVITSPWFAVLDIALPLAVLATIFTKKLYPIRRPTALSSPDILELACSTHESETFAYVKYADTDAVIISPDQKAMLLALRDADSDPADFPSDAFMDEPDPATYRQARVSPNWRQWHKAIQSEIDGILQPDRADPVTAFVPPGSTVLPSFRRGTSIP